MEAIGAHLRSASDQGGRSGPVAALDDHARAALPPDGAGGHPPGPDPSFHRRNRPHAAGVVRARSSGGSAWEPKPCWSARISDSATSTPAMSGCCGSWATRLGLITEVVPAVTLRRSFVSSSEIRRLIEAGDVSRAGRLLDRPSRSRATLCTATESARRKPSRR